MTHYRTLIVEDEILIADTIKRYLQKQGHEVIGTAISYEEAIQFYQQKKPDLALLDIRLSGSKTGIDVAYFLQEQNAVIPFIFLTSQLDNRNLTRAKETFPAGYLTKPIQKTSLYTTIEMAMYSYQARKKEEASIQLFDGTKYHRISINDIFYLEASHVYVKVYLKEDQHILQRKSLKNLLELLPSKQFVQTHRSFAVNTHFVQHWDNNHIYIQDRAIPLSRSRQKEFHIRLKKTGSLTNFVK